jgi:serine/threonine-protein kinase
MEGHLAAVPETARRHGGEEFALKSTAMAEHSLGHRQASQRALDELGARFATDCAYCLAVAAAWCGQTEAAFKWLQQAYAQRESDIIAIKYEPMFAPLRTDARFTALLRAMHLPE